MNLFFELDGVELKRLANVFFLLEDLSFLQIIILLNLIEGYLTLVFCSFKLSLDFFSAVFDFLDTSFLKFYFFLHDFLRHRGALLDGDLKSNRFGGSLHLIFVKDLNLI